MSAPQRKRELRLECFDRIEQLSDHQRYQSSGSICEQIVNLEEFKSATTVLSYLPLSTEPDLTPLFSDHSKQWAFSHVLNDTKMEFRTVNPNNFEAHLVKGDFGILEPDPRYCPLVSPEDADLVIIPGVGFCKLTQNRLGRGKGHYDRYLESINNACGALPTLIGVCFDVQLIDVPSESHDIPMTRLVVGSKH